MLIDFIAAVLLVIAIFKGIRKGLILAVLTFVAYIVGLAAAIKLSSAVADWLGNNVEVSKRWLPFLAFILILMLVSFLIRLGAKFLEGAVSMMMLGWANRLGGVLLYVLLYFFIYSTILFYAVQLRIVSHDSAEASITYPIIQPLAPFFIDLIAVIFPFFRNMFDDLLQFFGNVGESRG